MQSSDVHSNQMVTDSCSAAKGHVTAMMILINKVSP